ncbi:MAG: hypothetical protein OYG31_03125 [Candidatus Kaiserbacteria bacterium]|nr:hypothetical protein [Candidatus Kaiserbacteria bacterium]
MNDTENNATEQSADHDDGSLGGAVRQAREHAGSAIHGSLAILSFSIVTWLFDAIGAVMTNMQISLLKTLVTFWPISLVVGVTTGILSAIFEEVGETALATIGFVFGLQALLSTIVLCLFIFIATTAPRGYFSITDYLVAVGVFLLECIPFLSSFAFWGTFSLFLRRKLLRKATGHITPGSSLGNIGSSIGRVLGKK